MKVNSLRLGIIFGSFLALFHAAWAALVAIGWAQPLMDFILWAHFITPLYHVEPFAFARATILVVFVFITGLSFGLIAGVLWNRLASDD